MKAVKIKHHEDRHVTFSYEGAPAGAYCSYATPIDALFGRLRDELRMPLYRPGMLGELNIPSASVSRVRSHWKVPELWLLRMHEYSRIPINELRELANLEQEVFAHENARKLA